MNISKFILTAIAFCIVSKASVAQIDPHFSQYYAYPLLLNPALTGVVDGDYRVSINAKKQWDQIFEKVKSSKCLIIFMQAIYGVSFLKILIYSCRRLL